MIIYLQTIQLVLTFCNVNAMKDNMVSIVIGNVCIYFKENTLEGKQASGLLLRLNVHEVLSLRGAIFKRLMHIN